MKNTSQKLSVVKKRPGKRFFIILTIILVVAGIFFYKAKNKKEPITGVVQEGAVNQELVLTGSVNAVKYSSLAFPTSGKISWLGVTEGQKVKKGTAIISLDKTLLNATYQTALNNYRNYQAAADEVLDSVKGHSSDETFTQKADRTAAEVARDNAYDAVRAAQYNLLNSTIYAPFDGVVSSLPFTSPGVNISFTDTVAVIVDPATTYFDVDADQNDITNIKVGQDVTIVLDSFPNTSITGKVTFISYTPRVLAAGTSYKVKVEFTQNPDMDARVGMTGDAKFILAKKDKAFFVLPEFVKSDAKGKYIKYGKENNKVYLETGLESEDAVELISDKIQVGDTVYD